jgi:hypothetical protein
MTEKESKEFVEAYKRGEISNEQLAAFLNSLHPDDRELIATRQSEKLDHEIKRDYRNKMVKDWQIA